MDFFQLKRYHDPSLEAKVKYIETLGRPPADMDPEPEAIVEAKKAIRSWKSHYEEAVDRLIYLDEKIDQVNRRSRQLTSTARELKGTKWGEKFTDLMDQMIQEENLENLKREWSQTYSSFHHLKNIFTSLRHNDVQSQHTCQICSENLIDTFFDPCGHTICKDCLSKLRTNNCPYCRVEVVNVRPLFTN